MLSSYNLPGIFLIIISCIIFYNSKFEKNVFDNVKIVDVQVIEAPKSCKNVWKRASCKVKYNGKIHVITVGNKYCKNVSGKRQIKMKTNFDGSKLIFLNQKTTDFNNSFGGGFICLFFGVFLMFKAYKASKKHFN